MRAKMRVAVLGSGVLLALLIALLIVTATTGSTVSAVATGLLGLIIVVVCVVGGLFGVSRFVQLGDRSATLSRNQRALVERSAVFEGEATDSLDHLQGEVSRSREAAVDAERVQELEKQVVSRTQELEKQVASLERTVTILRRQIPEGFLEPVREELARLDEENRNGKSRLEDTWVLGTELAFQMGRSPRSFLTVRQATELFHHRLENEQLLEAAPLIRAYKLLERLDLGTLRTLYRFYRKTGYWDLAAKALGQVAEKSGKTGDRKALTALQREIAMFSNPARVVTDLPAAPAYNTSGPILHVVGRVLPETQSGFTLRTHYTARAQARRGLPVAVVGQSGIVEESAREAVPYSIDGVDYFRLPGGLRRGVPIDDWLRHDMEQLAKLVRRIRPSILHAHSDFQNALLVHAVGTAYGIPTVYETRGFWEESWLTRTITANGWGAQAGRLFTTYGRPAAYELRQRAETVARELVDRNITLAEVMKSHILELGDGRLEDEQVAVVPNAVDPEEFPVQERDADLAAELGIPEDAVTIGYISSMVEYEGIDTLIDGFRMAAERVSAPIRLLLVGDGKHLDALRQHAEKVGAQDIIFTGAVPHSDVLRYYGLIDVFVVPRRKSSVADLVTPLKPFEAFSTGRAVVLSDVDALQEIADASGAAETFRAGHHRDLGWKLIALVKDPQRRRTLGARGARWVRARRTWEHNVSTYYGVYRELGYRGPAADDLEEEHRRRQTLSRSEVPGSPQATFPATALPAGTDTGATGAPMSTQAATALEAPGTTKRGNGRRAVVVAMKPQIAGRIRRNIMTLLDLGYEVVVVNSTPRTDFFQGLEHPRLSADFVDVRSMAVRYQDRMTRKKNERQVAWDRQKKERAEAAVSPAQETPEWMSRELPGLDLVRSGWTSEPVRTARGRLDELSTTAEKRWKKTVSTSRRRRDLTIRDQLKQVHLINRFVEFWRLSPDRIAALEPDLIVSSDLPGLVGANIAARRLGVPHLHDCHELYLESTTLRPYERRVLWPVEKTYLKRVDSMVVVNETIRDEYERRYGVHGTVLRNAAPAVAEEVRRNPIDLHALVGLDRDAKIVIYQGGLVPGRGLDVCIRAAEHFPPGAHLVLIGKGKSQEELTALAAELDVEDRVHFLPAVEPGELPAYTAGADAGVIPYQPVSRNNEYALPNKAFEYPGAGIPFIASDLPELRRIAEQQRCGEVYDPFDPVALADAVTRVLDPARYEDYRGSAETFGRENTWEVERQILIREIYRIGGLT